MSCASTRELLQDWFDLAGGGPMPPDAAGHIRTCTGCRDFVRRWDQIELGLQALRDTLPVPSPDFRIALEAAPVMVKRRRRIAVPKARWAAATATALIAVIGLTYALAARGPVSVDRAGSLAIVRPSAPLTTRR